MKTTAELRLECLRLVYRHDYDAPNIVAKARILEAYVLEPKENAAVDLHVESKKIVGKTSTRSN